MSIKKICQQICPPILWDYLAPIKKSFNKLSKNVNACPTQQDLNVYWESDMAQILEHWGENNVWQEIEFIMLNCSGKVLDIACGTGRVMEIISKFSEIEVYGCDISDFLIKKAIDRGIVESKLKVCDATQTDYDDNFFDYGYSIGSLEHFTIDGIDKFLAECYRIVQKKSFHMLPVAASGENEGWLKTYQSFHNNSLDWWLSKFKSIYDNVIVLNSGWHDNISIGRWFICLKDNN